MKRRARKEKSSGRRLPRLADPQRKGGGTSQGGFEFQHAVAMLLALEALSKPTFSALLQEGMVDVELRFECAGASERWAVQVKRERLTSALARKVLTEFSELDKGHPGAWTRFIIASRGADKTISTIAQLIGDHGLAVPFYGEEGAARGITESARADLARVLKSAGCGLVSVDFVAKRVRLWTALSDVGEDGAALEARAIATIQKLRPLASSRAAAEALARVQKLIRERIRQILPRAELETALGSAADAAPSNADFDVYSHQRSLDLRGWKYVTQDRALQEISRAMWQDKLKLRRLRGEVNTFCIRHASTGLPTPEFSSDSHHVTVTETKELPLKGPRLTLRIFDACLDISGEPVADWFSLQLLATYWNAFNNESSAWAAIPAIHPTKTLAFEIWFPANKPIKRWERREGARDTELSEIVTDDAVEVSSDGTHLRWKIDGPRRNWVYKVVWEW